MTLTKILILSMKYIKTGKKMKKFYIIQWIGSEKCYVKKTYCGRIILDSWKGFALKFNKSGANKYLKKLQSINPSGEFSIREIY